MSFGCPVLSSNTSSLPEVYGDAALNFSPTSPDELLNCITKIINDNELKDTYIKKDMLEKKFFFLEKMLFKQIIYQKFI